MPELRKDPIVDRWVIIATERGMRPYDFSEVQISEQKGFCPFCYGNETKTPPEILSFRPTGSQPNATGWTLRVVPNKFPALRVEGEISRVGEGLYDKMSGNGAHEVIIENPNHDLPLEEQPVKSVEDCLWGYLHRMNDLKKDPRFRFILIFKNQGEPAGATLEHSHSQLIALPIIPETITEELSAARRHFQYKERCIFCDVISQERGDSRRIVSENDQFIAFCPYAPRFPFETWIMPKHHSARFESNGSKHFPNLAEILKDTLLRINRVLKAPPYNYYLHTSPLLGSYDEYYHWHFEIMPKTTKVAGFEQGTGCYINQTPPEEAARILREIKI